MPKYLSDGLKGQVRSLSLAFEIGLLGRTAAFVDAAGLCNLEVCARFVQDAFHATSANPEAAW